MKLETLIKHVAKTTHDMWDRGWTEANGGNVSLRLSNFHCRWDRSLLTEWPSRQDVC